jgi:hypothetical protein
MKVFYKIGDETLVNELEGEVANGENVTLLLRDSNLIEKTEWADIGYSVQPFMSSEDFKKIQLGLKEIIRQQLLDIGVELNDMFELWNYHHYVTDEQHLQLAKEIQFGWNVCHFPIEFEKVNTRMSKILGLDVCTKAWNSDFDNFFLRIVRPGKIKDNNPPHRDVWIDRLRNAVNIYGPVCGSDNRSSLPLMPGSHLISESDIERTADGAFLNGTKYTVPCVTSVNGKMLELIRPNPMENELLIFSPYMVHGGGYNLNQDATRVSLEIRFFIKTN